MEQKNGFGSKIQGLAKNVSAKSGELVENARLNGEIARLQGEQEDLLYELGQAYWEAHRGDMDCEFSDYVQKLLAYEQEIRMRQQRLLQNKGMMYCPHCDTVIGVEDAFCSKCGGRLPGGRNPAAVWHCRNCGTSVPVEEAFCPQCGLRLKP